MEQLLHYVWKHRLYLLGPLQTTGGRPVEIIDPGLQNSDAGPDFFNAKLRIDGVMWVGNVEIHQRASQWFQHGHHLDDNYNNVILHVVEEDDAQATCHNGNVVPQMVLHCPEEVSRRYDVLRQKDLYPACFSINGKLPKLKIHSWMSALQIERLQQKAELMGERLTRFSQDWERVLFVTISRNMGFGLNGDVFEEWASRLDYYGIRHHRDNPLQVEAAFMGMAGLLEETIDDTYYRQLQAEFRFLQHKFGFKEPLAASRWKLLRLHPGNFPYLRLSQLADLYCKEESLLSHVLEITTLDGIRKLLDLKASKYWETHYLFGKESAQSEKSLGLKSRDLIIINSIVPFLFAYGRHKSQPLLCQRALDFLNALKPENNYITRLWERFGIRAENAADSQALVQLQKQYCDRRDCLRCRFGYEYLKGRAAEK